MAERDAFGNPVGEDPLAVMGLREAPPAPVAVRPRRRRRRLAPRLAAALVPLVVAVGTVGAVLVVREEEERAAAPEATQADRIPGPLPEVRPKGSITVAEVERALAAVRAAAGAGARPVLVAIGPALRSFDVQVRTPQGGLRGFSVAGGRAEQTFDQGRAPARNAYAWDDIDPRAPARLTRTLKGVASLVLVRTQTTQWIVSAEDGTWFADPDGRDPRRP